MNEIPAPEGRRSRENLGPFGARTPRKHAIPALDGVPGTTLDQLDGGGGGIRTLEPRGNRTNSFRVLSMPCCLGTPKRV